jgi:hypothetical protein
MKMSQMFSDINIREYILCFPAFRFAQCILLYPVLSLIPSLAPSDQSNDILYIVHITELPEVSASLPNATSTWPSMLAWMAMAWVLSNISRPIYGWCNAATHVLRSAETSFCWPNIGAKLQVESILKFLPWTKSMPVLFSSKLRILCKWSLPDSDLP